jgi:predicted RNA binding protein YcfA (HicA-like mRNA interferase family)
MPKMTADDLIKRLTKAGWFQDRQNGSHKIFKHEQSVETIVVPYHKGEDLGKGLANKILKQAGLK